MALIFCELLCTNTKLSAFAINILCVIHTIPFDKKCHSEHETFVVFESMVMRLLWEYTLTDCTVIYIQFVRAV